MLLFQPAQQGWYFLAMNSEKKLSFIEGLKMVILYFATLILVRTRIVQRIEQFWYVPELFSELSNSGKYQNCSLNTILVRSRIFQAILVF